LLIDFQGFEVLILLRSIHVSAFKMMCNAEKA
jgi:hypothetical protein